MVSRLHRNVGVVRQLLVFSENVTIAISAVATAAIAFVQMHLVGPDAKDGQREASQLSSVEMQLAPGGQVLMVAAVPAAEGDTGQPVGTFPAVAGRAAPVVASPAVTLIHDSQPTIPAMAQRNATPGEVQTGRECGQGHRVFEERDGVVVSHRAPVAKADLGIGLGQRQRWAAS